MTDLKSNSALTRALRDINISPLCLEIRKGKRFSCLVCSAVVSIAEYSTESVVFATHKGRVTILGKELTISVLENRTVEVFGKILEVGMSYGKH